ncbi:MAG: tetratricopeptide repeat protein [Alphaproteobacteria bacterium]
MASNRLLILPALLIAMAGSPLASSIAMTTGSEVPSAASTSSGSSQTAALYAQAKASIDAGDYAAAIAPLQQIVVTEPRNADAYNLLGYASRSLERYNEAMEYYQRALAADPEHLGANEYYGELMLTLGNLPAAQERLAVLDEVCFLGCDEYDALAAAIDTYMAAE